MYFLPRGERGLCVGKLVPRWVPQEGSPPPRGGPPRESHLWDRGRKGFSPERPPPKKGPRDTPRGFKNTRGSTLRPKRKARSAFEERLIKEDLERRIKRLEIDGGRDAKRRFNLGALENKDLEWATFNTPRALGKVPLKKNFWGE